MSAVVVVVTVASVNDYQKEKQFRDLNAKKEDVEITVVRAGKVRRGRRGAAAIIVLNAIEIEIEIEIEGRATLIRLLMSSLMSCCSPRR